MTLKDAPFLTRVVSTYPSVNVNVRGVINNVPNLVGHPFFDSVFIIGASIHCSLIPNSGGNTTCCGNGIVEERNNEKCDGDNCQDNCQECSFDSFGQDCRPCDCENGVCDYGLFGSGKCLSCSEGYYGEYCNKTCSCQRGVCDDGVRGNGTCLTCFTNYYGELCDQYCYCGFGIYLNIK